MWKIIYNKSIKDIKKFKKPVQYPKTSFRNVPLDHIGYKGKKKGDLEDRTENVKTKVLIFNPIMDIEGLYIPYCSYHRHRGISESYEICEERDCRHYIKLYLADGT